MPRPGLEGSKLQLCLEPVMLRRCFPAKHRLLFSAHLLLYNELRSELETQFVLAWPLGLVLELD